VTPASAIRCIQVFCMRIPPCMALSFHTSVEIDCTCGLNHPIILWQYVGAHRSRLEGCAGRQGGMAGLLINGRWTMRLGCCEVPSRPGVPLGD
jgi:hypothetical protein